MFAITGITGQVGGQLADRLLAGRRPVRAVLRDPARAAAWTARGCEVALAAMDDAAALAAAFAGVEAAFVLLPPTFDPTPGFVEARRFVAAVSTALRAARVPHIGWNAVETLRAHVPAVATPEMVYYANGFACRPASESVVAAWTTHETDRFPAIVQAGTAVGVQFHPEKSSTPGVRFLRELLASTPTWRSTP